MTLARENEISCRRPGWCSIERRVQQQRMYPVLLTGVYYLGDPHGRGKRFYHLTMSTFFPSYHLLYLNHARERECDLPKSEDDEADHKQQLISRLRVCVLLSPATANEGFWSAGGGLK